MADYYTQFSTVLDVGGRADEAMVVVDRMRDELDADPENGAVSEMAFDCIEIDEQDGKIWIRSDENGGAEDAAAIILEIGKELGLKGAHSFEWANTCSKPRLDAFGGGAVRVDFDAQSFSLASSSWIAEAMAHPEFEETIRAMIDEVSATKEKSASPSP